MARPGSRARIRGRLEDRRVVWDTQEGDAVSWCIREKARPVLHPLREVCSSEIRVPQDVVPGAVRVDTPVAGHNGMVLEVLADVGNVDHRGNVEGTEFVRVSDARQHENLRSTNRPRRQDDLLAGGHHGSWR